MNELTQKPMKSTLTVDKELATAIKIAAAHAGMTIGNYVAHIYKIVQESK